MRYVDLIEVLIKRNKKVCSSKDLLSLFGKDYINLISRMTKTKWLIPLNIFRGVYYVVEPDERSKNILKMSSFRILIMVLNKKLGRDWYFGRLTALHLLGIIHQPVSIYYVFNKKNSKTVESKLFGKVVFTKTSAKITNSCGVKQKEYQKEPYNLSTTERTVADYLYLYVHGHVNKKLLRRTCSVLFPDQSRLRKTILGCYPKKSAIKMLTSMRLIK